MKDVNQYVCEDCGRKVELRVMSPETWPCVVCGGVMK